MAMSEAEMAERVRGYYLSTAFGADQPVVVDGVTFDYRCELDTKLWRPLAPLGTYGSRAALYGPRIIFPWTPRDWAKSYRKSGAIDAPVGSHIKVAFIQEAPVNTGFGDFDPPESRQQHRLWLWVFTPDGEPKVAEPPSS